MASINASTSGAGGVITTADNTGILNIQTAGTNAVTVDASQRVGIGGTTVTDSHLLNIQGSSATNNIGVVLNKTNATAQIWSITNSGPLTFYDYTSSAERMRIDSSGNLLFNSGYGSVATAYGCRAWVNFNGTGTVAIRASGNVSSITDNGTGDYTVNFTTAMPDVNYAFTQHISCASTGSVNDGCDLQSIATGSFRILCGNGGTALDANYAMFSIFR